MPRAPIISGNANHVAFLGGRPETYPAPPESDAPFRLLRPGNPAEYVGSPHGVAASIARTEDPPHRRGGPRRHVVEQRLGDGSWATCGHVEHHSDGTARYVPLPPPS